MSTHTTISWEEFLSAGKEGERWEWVDGEIVYMSPVGFWHEIILGRLIRALVEYCESHSGWICVPSNAAFTLSSGNWRLPDVSLIRKDRFPEGRVPKGKADFAPDIAFEILSPGNTPKELQRKRKDYQESAVIQVWIDPENRLIEVIQPDQPVRYFDESETPVLGLLPGFALEIGKLFETL
jgi:Uma2 family endonuclease